MPLDISYLSTEFLSTTVTASADPSANTPDFAFTTPGVSPEEADWVEGSWASSTESAGTWVAVARILIGANDTAVIPAAPSQPTIRWCWVRCTVGQETPVRMFDLLTVS